MHSPTLMVGSRLANGSWNTICRFRRVARASRRPRDRCSGLSQPDDLTGGHRPGAAAHAPASICPNRIPRRCPAPRPRRLERRRRRRPAAHSPTRSQPCASRKLHLQVADHQRCRAALHGARRNGTVHARRRRQQCTRVFVPRRCRMTCTTAPRSTTPPLRMTRTSSASAAMTPMSWVTSASAMPPFCHQLAQQREDLRLHRHVERGGGFVGDQQLRFAGQRHGDHRPLTHAARQLVRILRQAPRHVVHAHLFEQLRRALRAPTPAHAAMRHQRLGDLVADAQMRRQRASADPGKSSRPRGRAARRPAPASSGTPRESRACR